MTRVADDGGWAGVVPPLEPKREKRPRRAGVTMILDKGLGPGQLRDLLDVAGDYIDYVKFGFGTAALYDRDVLTAKVAMCRRAGVDVMPGGTFFELAAARGILAAWLARAAELGFSAIEISEGTVDLPPEQRHDAIVRAQAEGFRVLSEVGKKDPRRQPGPAALRRQIEADFASGVDHVIVEGRESGRNVGVFGSDGAVSEEDVDVLTTGLLAANRLIWEAPQSAQQIWLIRRFGCNVGLGNVAPADALAVEAQRTGLRGDTLGQALAVAAANRS